MQRPVVLYLCGRLRLALLRGAAVAVTAVCCSIPAALAAVDFAGNAATPVTGAPPGPALGARSGAKAPPVTKPVSKPLWQELTAEQQLSLKPLAAQWNTLGQTQKRKWIAIATGYPRLAPLEQAKMHNRMTDWVGLSSSQRAQARLNFEEAKKMTPDEKTASWQAYMALPAEEKKRLSAGAASKPPGVAATSKPVQAQKLAVVPTRPASAKQGPKMAAIQPSVDQNTLLPGSPPGTEAAGTEKN